MKRFTAALLTFAAVFTLLGGTGAAICFYIKYAPSGKMADQGEWFGGRKKKQRAHGRSYY